MHRHVAHRRRGHHRKLLEAVLHLSAERQRRARPAAGASSGEVHLPVGKVQEGADRQRPEDQKGL